MRIIFLLLPLMFSFVDPKIGGTIDIEKSVKLTNPEKIKLSVSLLTNDQVVATTQIKMPRFPQAFVLTERHKLNPQTPFQGQFTVKAELVDEVSMARYEVKAISPVGKKDLQLLLKN